MIIRYILASYFGQMIYFVIEYHAVTDPGALSVAAHAPLLRGRTRFITSSNIRIKLLHLTIKAFIYIAVP